MCYLYLPHSNSLQIPMETFEEVLEKIKKTNDMRQIVLNQLPLNSAHIEELFKILEEKNKKVEALSLNGCSIDDNTAITLFKLIKESKNNNLRKIELENNKIRGDAMPQIIETLREKPSLSILTLGNNQINPGAINLLSDSLGRNETSLTLLFLNENPMPENTKRRLLAAVGKNHTLGFISIASTSLDETNSEEIEKFIKENIGLSTLDFSRNNLEQKCISSILNGIRENKKIINLFLSRTHLGKQGLADVSSFLKSNDTLIELGLNANDISDEDFKNLAKSLEKNEKLERLSLDRNKITDKSAEAIEKLLIENKTLLELNFEKNQLTDAGAKIILRGLKQNTTLQELKLGDNKGISTDTLEEINTVLKRNNGYAKNFEKLIKEIKEWFNKHWAKWEEVLASEPRPVDNAILDKILNFIFMPSSKILEEKLGIEVQNLKSPEQSRYIRAIFSELSFYEKDLFEEYWRRVLRFSENNQNDINTMVTIFRHIRKESPLYERAHLESGMFFASKLSDLFRSFHEETPLDLIYFKNIISYLSSAEKYNAIFVSDEEMQTRSLETFGFYEDFLIKFCKNSYIDKNTSIHPEIKKSFHDDIMALLKSCMTILYFSPPQVKPLGELLLSAYHIIHNNLQEAELDVNADIYNRAFTDLKQKNTLRYPLIETEEDQKKMDDASKNIKSIIDKMLQDRRDYQTYLAEKEKELNVNTIIYGSSLTDIKQKNNLPYPLIETGEYQKEMEETSKSKKNIADELLQERRDYRTYLAENEKQLPKANGALYRYPFWKPPVPEIPPPFSLLVCFMEFSSKCFLEIIRLLLLLKESLDSLGRSEKTTFSSNRYS
ncbi:MAG: hypothetical protein ACD_44C00357G0001 [uncultured bacterium]|nr:MAG: hypothetical protein ACD_44C00357G0001 [uncultured bacterium]